MNELDKVEWEHHLLQLKTAARDQYYIQLLKQRMRLENAQGKGLFLKEYQHNQNIIKELEFTQKNVVFISLRPPPSVEFETFLAVMKKILNKKWLKRYIYTYEQKGETEDTAGQGFHAHIILYRDGKVFSEIKREIDNTIKHIIDLKVYSAHDYKLCDDDDDNVQRLLNYIQGTKKDKYKHASQEIDIYWRNKMGLAPYYENNFLQ